MAEHPDAVPQAVVEALAAQGIQTSRNFVCVVREKMGLPEPRAAEPKMPPGHLGFGECQQLYELYAAREVRAYEAGLIPHVPADRDSQ